MTSNGSDAASPSAPPEDRRVVRVEIVISWVLRVGVVTSLAVVLVGLVLIFVHHPELLTSTTRLQDLTQRGAVFPHTLSEVFQGALRTRGEAIVAVGLLLLILTPVTRVAVSILAFVYQRDRAYTFITLTVLIILLMSFVIGRLE
ncbi:MAG: DUF1634 domain-containing protein [Candidatus Brocadiia bacterium]|jgi:uncharacterized membrane protein